MSANIYKLIRELKNSVSVSLEKITKLKPEKWSLSAFFTILPEILIFVRELISNVEKIGKELKATGYDKKIAVMAILDGLVNDGVIKVPYIPKWLTKKILSFIVDLIVKYLNDKFGKGKGQEKDKDWVDEPSIKILSIR